ncbi:YjjW family glycine radical enzyme activase [Spirochaetota bacterium]
MHCGICVAVCPTKALSQESVPVSEEAPYGLHVSWDPSQCINCGACIAACPHDSSPKARTMSPEETLSAIDKYKPFLSGITVSGGECGLQPEYLEALLVASRDAGLPGLVDTNGSLDFSLWPRLVDAAEGFMLDVKAWDEDEHQALTGLGNVMVKANLRFLLEAGKLYELRTVVAPGLFDAEKTVREVAAILAEKDSRIRYKLIRFRPQGVRAAWRDSPQPDEPTMDRLAAIARDAGLSSVIVV